MKKLLLSLVALMAAAVSASAQDSYTATGYVRSAVDKNLDTLAIGGYSWDTYSPLVTFDEPRTVEVSSEKIVVKDWYGYGNTSTGEPYDLVCKLDEDGHITSFFAQVGDTEYPYYNTYVYTGYDDYYAVGFSAWTETYGAYTQCVSDAASKSGYLFLYGTLWKNDYSDSKSGYYFLPWGDYKFEVSPYVDPTHISVLQSEIDADGATYNVAGQKVGKSYKGLVIKNGKKFIQR